jgi:eukaryotic-like serine/threonine-protein kinase
MAPDGRSVVVQAEQASGPSGLYLLDVDGTAVRRLTPDGIAVGALGWAVSPDGAMVALSTAQGVDLFPVAAGVARSVPGSLERLSVAGWIESGVLVAEDPVSLGRMYLVDPETGRRETWADIAPQDSAGIMNLNLSSFVVTPDGRGYGYTWHRAISDLFLVEGWG